MCLYNVPNIVRLKINVSDSKLPHLSTDNQRLLYKLKYIVNSATGIRFY